MLWISMDTAISFHSCGSVTQVCSNSYGTHRRAEEILSRVLFWTRTEEQLGPGSCSNYLSDGRVTGAVGTQLGM